MVYVFEDTMSVVSQKPAVMKRSYSMENLKNICPPKSLDVPIAMDVPMDVAMANMNISQNNSLVAQWAAQEKASMDVAMANMNISQNNSLAAQWAAQEIAAQRAVQEKGFKRSPQMKRTNGYQNQGPRKMQKPKSICV